MSKSTSNFLKLPGPKGKEIIANFNGGQITSDGGILLLREVNRKTNLLSSVAKILPDKRDPAKTKHSVYEMLSQRVFGLALGYEDLNDHNTLRLDDAWKVSVGSDKPLASSPTLCRFENNIERQAAVDIHKILADQFIASYKTPPEEIVLDFDATDDLVHGTQIDRHFHGYYGNYCFLPLYVFCGMHLLVAYLRPSNQDQAKHAGAVLKLLVSRIRQDWPHTRIIIRADSGFNRRSMISWCERNNVKYIVGMAKNERLKKHSTSLVAHAEELYNETREKQVLFSSFQYAAESWKSEKTIIVKAEHSDKGPNTRYVLTNLEGDPQKLYQEVYCARGDMENRIKEQQLFLFADRTSAHNWWPNQFRLLLSSLAYTLVQHLRSTALVNTPFERAQIDTIRLKLFKIGTLVQIKTRRIYFLFASSYPYQDVFKNIYNKLVPT